MKPAVRDDEAQTWTHVIPFKEYYSAQDASVLLFIGSASVYAAINRGTLKGVRVNGVVHIRHEDLIAYITRRAAIPSSGYVRGHMLVEDIIPPPKPTSLTRRPPIESVNGGVGMGKPDLPAVVVPATVIETDPLDFLDADSSAS